MIKGRDLRRAVVNWLLVLTIVGGTYTVIWLFAYFVIPDVIMKGR